MTFSLSSLRELNPPILGEGDTQCRVGLNSGFGACGNPHLTSPKGGGIEPTTTAIFPYRGRKKLGYATRFICIISGLLALTACGDSKERIPADAPGYVNGKPVHPTIKIGKPYKVKDETYYPEYKPEYVEEGIASWYGPNFHGKSTANGERYNQYAMTAAHKTLPMPSMVRVTNKKTGKSIVVRVNDRGPFAAGRVIDLSRAAAEELGMIGAGTAPVKVEYLKAETERYIAKLQLKKPAEWTDRDVQLAKAEDHYLDTSGIGKPDPIDVSNLHPVEPAEEIPNIFAFNSPLKEPSTLEAKGVKIEEIGYAQDAFSILDSAHAATPNTPPPKRVSYVAPNTPPPDYTQPALIQPNPEPLLTAAGDWIDDPPPDKKPADVQRSTFVAPINNVGRSPSTFPGTYTFRPKGEGSERTALAGEGRAERQATGRYFVLAGSFSNPANAQNLAVKLSGATETEIMQVHVNNKPFHRLRLGPCANDDIAQELVARLRDYGINDAKIIKE